VGRNRESFRRIRIPSSLGGYAVETSNAVVVGITAAFGAASAGWVLRFERTRTFSDRMPDADPSKFGMETAHRLAAATDLLNVSTILSGCMYFTLRRPGENNSRDARWHKVTNDLLGGGS
jgi:hypothetical protein